jgi:hypothetical protein
MYLKVCFGGRCPLKEAAFAWGCAALFSPPYSSDIMPKHKIKGYKLKILFLVISLFTLSAFSKVSDPDNIRGLARTFFKPVTLQTAIQVGDFVHQMDRKCYFTKKQEVECGEPFKKVTEIIDLQGNIATYKVTSIKGESVFDYEIRLENYNPLEPYFVLSDTLFTLSDGRISTVEFNGKTYRSFHYTIYIDVPNDDGTYNRLGIEYGHLETDQMWLAQYHTMNLIGKTTKEKWVQTLAFSR